MKLFHYICSTKEHRVRKGDLPLQQKQRYGNKQEQMKTLTSAERIVNEKNEYGKKERNKK